MHRCQNDGVKQSQIHDEPLHGFQQQIKNKRQHSRGHGGSRGVVLNRCLFLLGTQLLLVASLSIVAHHYLASEENLTSNQHEKEAQKLRPWKRSELPHAEAVEGAETQPQILLVHIGKTGGETLKHVLRIGCLVRNNQLQKHRCWRALSSQYNASVDNRSDASRVKEPVLSRAVTGYFHYRRVTPPSALNQSTHYLFMVRHPLERIQSWFRYISPLNCVMRSNNTTRHGVDSGNHRRRDLYGIPVNCRVREAFKHNPESPEAKFFGCFPTLEHMAKRIVPLSADQAGSEETENSEGKSDKSTCVGILLEILQSNYAHYWERSESLLGHFVMNYHVSFSLYHSGSARSKLNLTHSVVL